MKKILIVLMALAIFAHAQSNENKESFERLLRHVPQDTLYLLGNKNPLPKKILDTQFAKITQFVEAIDKFSENNNTRQFFDQYYRFNKAFQEDKLDVYGIKKDMQTLLYGYKLNPVLRMQLNDSKKFIAYINSIAKESNESIPWEECGAYPCIHSPQGKQSQKIMLTLVVLETELAIALYDISDKNEMQTHLLEKALAKSYTPQKFNTFLQENNFLGYGDGFIDLDAIVSAIADKIKTNSSPKQQKEIEQCAKVVFDLSQNIPKLSIGFSQLNQDHSLSSLILHTKPDVSKHLKRLSNLSKLKERVSNPLIEMELNLNATELTSALGALTNFIASSAQEHNCTQIQTTKLRQNVAMVTLSLAMGLEQVSEIYIALNDIEVSPQMVPAKISGIIQIVSKQPQALIAQLGMLSPSLANITFPKSGKTIDLKPLLTMLPPSIDSLKASIKDNIISLYLGDKPKMEKYSPKAHTLMRIKIDEERYYALFSKFMKKGMQNSKFSSPQQNEQTGSLIDMLYTSQNILQQRVFVDDRGLVIDIAKDKK